MKYSKMYTVQSQEKKRSKRDQDRRRLIWLDHSILNGMIYMIIFKISSSFLLSLMTGTPRNGQVNTEFFIYLRRIRNNPILPIIIARSILFPCLPHRSKMYRVISVLVIMILYFVFVSNFEIRISDLDAWSVRRVPLHWPRRFFCFCRAGIGSIIER